MTDENQFDDFKSPEIGANDAIVKVIAKELTEAEEFKEEWIDNPISMADSPKEQLREMYVQYIQRAGDVNQVNYCDYHTKTGIALDGWGFAGDDDNVTIDLFLVEYVDPEKSTRISPADLEKLFARLERFYDHSVSGSIFKNIDNSLSDLYQVAQLIQSTNKIDRIRLFILTNAIAPLEYEKNNTEFENGTTVCEYHVWDARRVMQQDHIISGRDSIKVDFEGDYNCSLPCIKMPDVSKSVSCYLCIIPGTVLSQVYHKYNQQILEMNVRTFLQFKGTSNKGIRNTLIGYKAKKRNEVDIEAEPDMFFAYNNGISATASEVVLSDDERNIVKIKDWQIVNGGQTTAAIHAVMRMNDAKASDLAAVYVAMKISVIKDKEQLNVIVPKISRFANTQSAVKKSDYDINEGFLVDLEQRSREEWVLNSMKNPVSKWFFERTRGQYLDKAKRNSSAKAEREFYAEYPKTQMFDKTTLSKFMMAWDQNPASVCKGGENNYGVFFEKTKKSGVRFDAKRYKRTVAKAILFKAIDAFYGKDGLQLPGYKSNMVAYTMSAISFNSGKALNLDAIWDEQCIISQAVYNELPFDIYSVYARLVNGNLHIPYKVKETYTDADGRRRNRYIAKEIPLEDIFALRNTVLYKTLMYVKSISQTIYQHLITNVHEGENINEWTKKPTCWDTLKLTLGAMSNDLAFPKDLCSANGDQDIEVSEGQQKIIVQATSYNEDVWFSINRWGKEYEDKLSPKEIAFIGQVAWNIKRNKPLTYKQAKWALDILEKATDMGWELEQE